MAGADHIRRRAAAEQQSQRVDDDGLPAAGLPRQQVQAGVEADAQPVHHRVVFDYQLKQHCSRL